MIRFALPLIAVALMGCTPVAGGNPYALPPAPSEATPCGSQHLGSFIGMKHTDAVAARIATASGAKSIRWIKPGMAVTMDYREDRLNVKLDDKGTILSFNCG